MKLKEIAKSKRTWTILVLSLMQIFGIEVPDAVHAVASMMAGQ